MRTAWLILFSLPVLADDPSAFQTFNVHTTPNWRRADYNASIVVPNRLSECHDFIALSAPKYAKPALAMRHEAREFLSVELEQEGFPRGSAPAPLEAEYNSVLEDSSVVIVRSGPGPNGEPPVVLGVISISYDFGQGTAGERRLKNRMRGFSGFPRAPYEDKFIDFVYRDSTGNIAVSKPLSLLLSLRKFRVGGLRSVAEIKTFFVKKDLSFMAKRLKISEPAVRVHVLAVMQHMLATHCILYSAEAIPKEEQIIIPTVAEFEDRLRKLKPEIDKLFPEYGWSNQYLVDLARKSAFDPPPQPFTLIDKLYTETGGIDPLTGRDRLQATLKLFESFFNFKKRLFTGQDPDVPTMSVAISEMERVEFEMGQYLERRRGWVEPVENGFLWPNEPQFYNPTNANLIFTIGGGANLSNTYFLQPHRHLKLEKPAE